MAGTSTVTVLRPKQRIARPFPAQPPQAPMAVAGRPPPVTLLAPLLLAGGVVAGMLMTALWLRDLEAIGMAIAMAAAFTAGSLFWRRAARHLNRM